MTEAAADFWQRAKQALKTARLDLSVDPDAAASRAYYAAFYAVSAWFVLEDRIHKKHSAVEVAVHRDLVNSGIMTSGFGDDYSHLFRLRAIGDYGVSEHVSPEEAAGAVESAAGILRAIAQAKPFFKQDLSDI
jgi:uncharacterized protein (UPF0332 family)